MDDIEFDHSAEGQRKFFVPEPDYWAMAEAEYKRLFGGQPELIKPKDYSRLEGEDRFAGGSFVWDVVDWTM